MMRLTISGHNDSKGSYMTRYTLSPSDQQVASLLTDYADGIAPLEDLLLRYHVARGDVEDLIALSDELRDVLVEVLPAPAFVAQLYEELTGQSAEGRIWWGRVQAMPPRMKIAASIGVTAGMAGVLLITARSLWNRFDFLHREGAPGKALA